MQLKNIIDSPCHLRYMIDNLDIQSGFARRHLLDGEMETNQNNIESNYLILRQFHQAVANNENQAFIHTLEFKLRGVKDIHNSLNRLKVSTILDDIELFEIKFLGLLTADIKKILKSIGLENVINLPDLEEIINILDPDGLHIASFYIYDSYSEKLKELRKQMKKQPDFKEDIFNEANALEDEIRENLSQQLKVFVKPMEETLLALALVDIHLAKAKQIDTMGLCFPNISKNEKTEYQGLFHSEVKAILSRDNIEYQCVDISFGLKPTIITGANMGGKTVVIKTLALSQYLFQFGFGIPAKSAEIMIQDEVFCCTTDEQSINKGLSSFAAEMRNIDAVIKASREEKRILALIDEPARTTNPTEGTALVSALVKILQEKTMSLVIVTHYNIDTYGNRCLRVRGLENGRMNYELVESCGGEVPHEALNIAVSLGIDNEWIENAKEILSKESN